jgi:WhiB family transcriptional regulator, redox-sensing transcriptional regulator
MSENWRKNAECRDEDPNIFDPSQATMTAYYNAKPEGKLHPKFDMVRRAVATCGRCAVKDVCLSAALENNEQVMIWGGMTVNERELLSRSARSRRRA